MALYLLGKKETRAIELLDFAREYLTDQNDEMKKLITLFLNLVMKYELEQQTGTSRYERSENRTAHRNGKRNRILKLNTVTSYWINRISGKNHFTQ